MPVLLVWSRSTLAMLLVSLAAALALGAPPARGDTVYLVNGGTVDGAVSYPNDNSVAVEAPGGRLVLMRSEVERVEQNDRRGTNAATPLTRQHEDMLTTRTGLTEAQRQEVLDVLAPLKSEDPVARSEARRQLVRLQGRHDLFPFLEYALAGFSPAYATQVLAAMAQMDRARALPIVRHRATDTVPDIRATAVALLGELEDKQAMDLVTRAAIDQAAPVRLEAFRSLAALGAREATPLLLRGLVYRDRRARNVARDALAALWAGPDAPPADASPEAWGSWWEVHRDSTAAAIDPASLEPLTDPTRLETHAWQNE